jgi:hypothetical protein
MGTKDDKSLLCAVLRSANRVVPCGNGLADHVLGMTVTGPFTASRAEESVGANTVGQYLIRRKLCDAKTPYAIQTAASDSCVYDRAEAAAAEKPRGQKRLPRVKKRAFTSEADEVRGGRDDAQLLLTGERGDLLCLGITAACLLGRCASNCHPQQRICGLRQGGLH